jgi:hypothetical protein
MPDLDLILLKQFLDLYRHSPIVTVYIHGLSVSLSIISYLWRLICTKNTDYMVRKSDAVVQVLYIVAGGEHLFLFCLPTGPSGLHHLISD